MSASRTLTKEYRVEDQALSSASGIAQEALDLWNYELEVICGGMEMEESRKPCRMPVSHDVVLAVRHLDATPCKGPRIPHRQTYKNFEPREENPHGMLFRNDLKDMMLFAELGEMYLRHGTCYWEQLLTTRQFLELICFRNRNCCTDEDKSFAHDMVWNPDSFDFHKFQSEILDIRFYTGTQLQKHYGSESKIFLPADCDEHFDALKALVLSDENRRWWVPLALLLRSANDAVAIKGIREGLPWFQQLPSGKRVW